MNGLLRKVGLNRSQCSLVAQHKVVSKSTLIVIVPCQCSTSLCVCAHQLSSPLLLSFLFGAVRLFIHSLSVSSGYFAPSLPSLCSLRVGESFLSSFFISLGVFAVLSVPLSASLSPSLSPSRSVSASSDTADIRG